ECARHLAVADDLIADVACHIAGTRESDSLISAGFAQNRGADTDQPPFRIHQRTSGIPRIDRSIGLDEVFVVLYAKSSAAGCAHDTHRYSLANAKWIPARQND